MLLGVSLWLSGSREEGIGEARRAVRLDPQSAEAHYNLGTMLQMAGQLEGAAQHLAAAVNLKPDHLRAADALESVRAALRQQSPFDSAALLPPRAEAVQGEGADQAPQADETEPAGDGPLETATGRTQPDAVDLPTPIDDAAAPPADEPVEAAPEQAQPGVLDVATEAPEPDWFDALTEALQTIGPPADAGSAHQEDEQAEGESDSSKQPD
jgi:tetratricopeptide (TPR) repeat protein